MAMSVLRRSRGSVARNGSSAKKGCAGTYARVLCTDDARWGGSDYGVFDRVPTEDVPYHGRRDSIGIPLPPLSVLVLVPERIVPRSLRSS